jgi:hypothetical protein
VPRPVEPRQNVPWGQVANASLHAAIPLLKRFGHAVGIHFAMEVTTGATTAPIPGPEGGHPVSNDDRAGGPAIDSFPTRRLEWERTVYNMLFRVLGNRKTAKHLIRQLALRGISAEIPITHQARDLAKDELVPDEYALTLFGRAREILSQSPDVEDLPRLRSGFDKTTVEREIKEVLPREHVAILELVFVDRRPFVEVAELIGVSSEYLMTFLCHLVDLLGDLSEMVHDGTSRCPHPLQLIRSQVEKCLGYEERKDIAGEDCHACRTGLELTGQILEMFSCDSRILSLGDDALIKRAIRGHRVKVNEGLPVLPPHPDKRERPNEPLSLPSPNPTAWKIVGGLCAMLLVWVTVSAVTPGGPETETAGFNKGMKALKHEVIGTYSDMTSPSKELIAQTTLTAGTASSLFLTWHAGIQVEVCASASVTVLTNRVQVHRGRVRVRTTEGANSGFFIALPDVTARLKEGDVIACLSDSSPLRFSLRTGALDVKDKKGKRYRLEPSNVMRVAGAGFAVEESTAEDIASASGKNAANAGPDAHSVQ